MLNTDSSGVSFGIQGLAVHKSETLLYGLVHNASDALHLQRDLDSLVTWAQEWQMNFHPSKCYVFRICRIKNPIIHHYTVLGQTLKAVDHQPFLGITISETLNWKTHVLDVKNKANVTLHGKTSKKVITQARYFNTLNKRKFL